ncbi:MAG: GTP diphosphokinase [Gammaproteobacteria bacterium]|nr:GTP diphosphokinase [Gammaproteobacteria bacterium]
MIIVLACGDTLYLLAILSYRITFLQWIDMVYVEQKITVAEDDTLDIEKWLTVLERDGRSEEEIVFLRHAAQFAQQSHHGQIRASGEPYFSHVIAVAAILSELNMDVETLAAAILHDTVEDTPATLEQIDEQFGASVATLVDSVTKMQLITEMSQEAGDTEKKPTHAENQRKLILAMAKDVRVVLIKLADRLHNMRTLKHLPVDKQERIAKETVDIYAPLANRLGIWQLKWELEDLGFRYLEPVKYKQIANSLDERRVERERYINMIMDKLRSELEKAGITAQVTGRPKHIYSIWRKMQRKGVGIHEIFDTRAVRVMVDTLPHCYHALGIVHTLWPHIHREFDDYIATPKENRYQSIHTAVIGPQGKTLEIQIRTQEMHEHSELGVAAHWRYKEGGKGDNDYEQKIAWLRQVVQWKDEEPDANDFIDRFKSEVFQDRIYVLTPGGDIIDLPQGATPLDFAYHIHSEVGHCCRGAKVDGRMVSLGYELQSGEQVEVLNAKHGGPSRDWLNPHLGYLKSSRARSHVRAWFKHQDYEQHVIDGRISLERELGRLNASSIGYEKLAAHFKLDSSEALMAAIGRGDIHSGQITGAIEQLWKPERSTLVPSISRRRRKEVESGDIHIHGVGNLLTNMARCCKPAPGDEIIGFITRGRGVSIHRSDCPNVLKFDTAKRARLIEVEWSDRKEDERYPVDIRLQAIDRGGLLRDITSLLAEDRINVLRVNTHSDNKDYTAHMELTIEISDTTQLSRILSRIEALPNVLQVKRQSH